MVQTVPPNVIGELREAVVGLKKTKIGTAIVEPQEAVLARYQPVFSADHLPQISEDEFRSFLNLENNHHWSGLHRQGPRMCSDMAKLREALAILVDESKAVDQRLNRSTEMISGMGRNVATAILIVTQPDRYGVWNTRSEATMKQLGIWPQFDRGESLGSQYVKVNQVLLQLCDALEIDLWTLDAVWWYLDQEEIELVDPDSPDSAQRFGLERHLHEFIRDNWDHLELGQDWMLYQEPGNDEAGYEYSCAVGKIDLLAKHRNKPQWLVIELKRNQTSDQTMGQLLRYVGWVKQHKAEGDEVHGMIICHEADDALRYAISTVQNVDLQLYEVEFRLKPACKIGASQP